MNCHYCGSPLRDNDIFCRNCGTRQQSEPLAATPVEPIEAEPEIPVAPVEQKLPTPTVYKEKTFDWQPYGAPVKEEPLLDLCVARAPKLQLPVKRSLAKMFFLGILTLGIYPMVIWSRLVGEVNIVASRYDGERSMSFFGMLMLSPLTLGIHSLVWMHKLCRRMGNELQRRSISYTFGPRDFWLWAFLLSLLSSICTGVGAAMAAMHNDISVVTYVLSAVSLLSFIGPLVFTAKITRAANALNADFNING